MMARVWRSSPGTTALPCISERRSVLLSRIGRHWLPTGGEGANVVDGGARMHRFSRFPTRMVADVVAIVATGAVVVGLSRSAQIGEALRQPVTNQVSAVVSAVIATGVAVQAATATRLDGDTRPRWVGAALVLYTFVVVPLSAFVVLPADPAGQRGARLLGYLIAVGLLVVSLRPPPRVGPAGTWAVAAAGAALTLVTLTVPPVAHLLGSGQYLVVVLAVTGAAVTAAVVVDGYRRLSRPWWRVGLGLALGALGHLYAIGGSPGDQNVALALDGLRIVALLAVVAGFAQLSTGALAELRSEHSAQQEELIIAVVHMERAAELAAERDHELRNGLAGLAGITHLLSMDRAGEEHERLRHAVLAELGRLNALVDSGSGQAESDAVDYRVESVLAGLAILRRSAVAAVEADIDPALRVVGDPAVLAQVVTNLLANCERHAPGAHVVLRAYRSGDNAVVEVRDEGPGLSPDIETVVLERGVHDSAAGGAGLGLYISRRLVEREGGTLQVRTVDGPRGCLATVTIPRSRPRR